LAGKGAKVDIVKTKHLEIPVGKKEGEPGDK
jgi:hypothetical protein